MNVKSYDPMLLFISHCAAADYFAIFVSAGFFIFLFLYVLWFCCYHFMANKRHPNLSPSRRPSLNMPV